MSAVSEKTHRKLHRRQTLSRPAKILLGPTGSRLKAVGQFKGTLKNKNHRIKETIYVVQGLKSNLLGMPAIRALHLIPEVNAITEEQDWVRKFPDLFQGLGTLGEEYTIHLRENATPFALSTPRNVPLPLREKVKKELEQMEQLGVVRKVQEHTPWCAAMVVVPKSSGKEVHICVD